MLRGFLRTLGLSACLAFVLAGDASAQWGYGYYPYGYQSYGWGGWGGATAQGDIARGLGYYAAGAGQYNLATAEANAINANTALQWNEYMYDAQVHAGQVERARMAKRSALEKAAFETTQARIQGEPSESDILSGNALNAALTQLSDPRIQSSALRAASTKIPGKVIREIPFVNASEAITICLDQLTNEKSWPPVLRAPALSEEREAYGKAIDQAMAEDADGDLSPKTIAQVRTSLSRLRAKFEANPPADRVARSEAEAHLKALYGMTRMLDRPDIEKILAELDTIKETSLGNLLGFMQTFNLRFGRATTPGQNQAYRALYPLLGAQRDKMVASLRPEPTDASKTPEPPKPAKHSEFHPGDFFSQMHLDHLDGPHRVLEKPSDKDSPK
jgi:hypothetical protein